MEVQIRAELLPNLNVKRQSAVLLCYYHLWHSFIDLPTATFDVQGKSITCDQGVVKVTCIFARGSLAQGCL